MAVYHTVDGQPYSVTAGTDVTVTDADGLILGVSAGGQGSFVGNGGDVTITGEHHFVQIKGGGGGGNGGGGGGGEPFDGNLPNNDLRVGELGGDKKIYLNGVEIMQESTVIVDVVEANNANAVTSNAVFNALQEKQDELEWDASPTQGSLNPVYSDGIYSALGGKQDNLTAGTNITIENNVISASGGEPFDGNLDADLHVGTVGGPIRKIYLNGVELDVRNAPVPEPLPSDNVLKHGRVYVIEVTEDTDFSAITVEEYATAELWIDYTAGSVTTSSDWSWVDGIDLPPTLAAGTRYMLVLRNTGNAILVKLDCSYKDVND